VQPNAGIAASNGRTDKIRIAVLTNNRGSKATRSQSKLRQNDLFRPGEWWSEKRHDLFVLRCGMLKMN
jgi:hypothetical protein